MAARQRKELGIPQGRVLGRRFPFPLVGRHTAAGVPRKVRCDDTGKCNIGVSGGERSWASWSSRWAGCGGKPQLRGSVSPAEWRDCWWVEWAAWLASESGE